MNRRTFMKSSMVALAASTLYESAGAQSGLPTKRPNILFCLSDDQSWLHAGVYGCKAVRTPAMDRLAQTGIRFNHAYCACPSCAPSRAAVLTGQETWRLGAGANLWGRMPAEDEQPVYTRLLAKAGYHVGFTGKGWWPGSFTASGWKENPAGKAYQEYQDPKVPHGVNHCDYARNFEAFIQDKADDQPFCFWYGCHEPHRDYMKGIGIKTGMDPRKVEVPDVMPDTPEVRSDILDYLYEIEHYDKHLARMIQLLEAKGLMDNTLIVVTSDNGMPFPRGKANLYDLGTRMPMVISWQGRIRGPRVLEDMVSLIDMAPTFLEAAGLKVPDRMTGKSLLPILDSRQSGLVDKDRTQVFTALERHAWVRPNGVGYPCRAIRTHDYLYIYNFEPDRWPAGDPYLPTFRLGVYGDIDNGPTKDFMNHSNDAHIQGLWRLATAKRPAEELYDLKNDPSQVHNVAADPTYQKLREQLHERLFKHLRETGDPRADGAKVLFDTYPYYGPDAKPK